MSSYKEDWKKIRTENPEKWEQKAIEVMSLYCDRPRPCRNCGYPVMPRYCCRNKNCSNPADP